MVDDQVNNEENKEAPDLKEASKNVDAKDQAETTAEAAEPLTKFQKFRHQIWPKYLKYPMTGLALALFLCFLFVWVLAQQSEELLDPRKIDLSSQLIDVPEKPEALDLSKSMSDMLAAKKEEDTTSFEARAEERFQKKQSEHGSDAPYSYYRIPADRIPVSDRVAKIAIIIMDVGLNTRRYNKIFQQAPNYSTLAFSAYTDIVSADINDINKSFENWLMLPTETYKGLKDPGPMGLYNNREEALNSNAFISILDKNEAFTGFVLPPYSAFPLQEEQYRALVDVIYDKGYGIADASFETISPDILLMGDNNFPYFQVDQFIDEDLSDESIIASLRRLEIIARESGSAIGIIRPYPLSLRQLELWSKSLNERGFSIVPLSNLFEPSGNFNIEE